MSAAVLVQFSNLDLQTLLPLVRQGLGRSVCEAADSIGADPPLHHILCVAALKEPDLRPSGSACRPYSNLFHAGFLVAADERDMAEIFEIAGMPCIMVDTVQRGLRMAFISGTLDQWRAAVLKGCLKETSTEARSTYNRIYGEFNKLGLVDIFEAKKKESSDQTFLLEHKK